MIKKRINIKYDHMKKKNHQKSSTAKMQCSDGFHQTEGAAGYTDYLKRFK